MKTAYIVAGTILICSHTIFMTSCKNNPRVARKQTVQQPVLNNSQETDKGVYAELRSAALSAAPAQLGLSLPVNKNVVYGVIMDWEIGGDVATVVSYQTGDASLYLSSGGGIIGGGDHERVSDAAKRCVSLAQEFISNANKVADTILPGGEEVKFHLLTNAGIYSSKEQMVNFENNTSQWLPLFEEGNKVLTELRKTSENKK